MVIYVRASEVLRDDGFIGVFFYSTQNIWYGLRKWIRINGQ